MKVNSEAAAGAKLVGALFELLIPANQVDVVVGDWAEGWSKSPLGRRECRRPSSGTASLLSDRQRGWLQDILDNVGAIKRHLDHLAAPDFDSFQSDEPAARQTNVSLVPRSIRAASASSVATKGPAQASEGAGFALDA